MTNRNYEAFSSSSLLLGAGAGKLAFRTKPSGYKETQHPQRKNPIFSASKLGKAHY